MLKFEWDDAKASQNLIKHGVSFELATRVFEDPELVLAEDAGHSEGEARFFAFGKVEGGIVTVRFAVRGERIRIIGAGHWRKGRVYYEQANRLPR
jgi:uncharacterized DUF497 family protein